MYHVFKDKMKPKLFLHHSLDLGEDSESDCDSVLSMKGSRKKVHFSDSEDENKADARQTKKMDSLKRGKKTPNFKLLSLNRGDIPNGSDVFRQVLMEIKSTDDNEDAVQTDKDRPRSISPPGKSILKKR